MENRPVTDSLKEKKTAVRKEVLKKRDSLSKNDILAKSLIIKNRFLSLPDFIKARTLLFYVSFRSEVYTHDIIKDALVMGKTVTVPLTDKKNSKISACRIKSFDDLSPGAWGIPEPEENANSRVSAEKLDLLVVPGVAFCERGWRLGYGGGFFDQFTKGVKCRSIGFAFDFQVLNDIPHDKERDMRADFVITDKRLINCIS